MKERQKNEKSKKAFKVGLTFNTVTTYKAKPIEFFPPKKFNFEREIKFFKKQLKQTEDLSKMKCG